MQTVIQRVTNAHITIAGSVAASIKQGLLILCGFEPDDNESVLELMLNKCLHYRIFSDVQGKTNLNLKDINGELLLIPQFTLIAETSRGLRPSFSKAAPHVQGEMLFQQLTLLAKRHHDKVAFGQFGADMQVTLCNDGPMTFILPFKAKLV